jgi:hypothetical protein
MLVNAKGEGVGGSRHPVGNGDRVCGEAAGTRLPSLWIPQKKEAARGWSCAYTALPCPVQAFDVLERLDPDPTYWEGKRGACIGVFQLVIAGEEPDRALSEVVQILRNTTNNPRVDKIVRVMNLWARDNGVALDEVEDDEA